MKTEIATQQQIIRQLSAPYLALQAPKWPEFRKPFARKPDDSDEKPDCPHCDGTGELEDETMCMSCLPGIVDGRREFEPEEVFLTVYRDQHSIELLVNTRTWEAFVPRKSGVRVGELSGLEQQTALEALK